MIYIWVKGNSTTTNLGHGEVPSLGWLQIVGFAGIVELNIYNQEVNDEPGDEPRVQKGQHTFEVVSFGGVFPYVPFQISMFPAPFFVVVEDFFT